MCLSVFFRRQLHVCRTKLIRQIIGIFTCNTELMTFERLFCSRLGTFLIRTSISYAMLSNDIQKNKHLNISFLILFLLSSIIRPMPPQYLSMLKTTSSERNTEALLTKSFWLDLRESKLKTHTFADACNYRTAIIIYLLMNVFLLKIIFRIDYNNKQNGDQLASL